MKSITLFGSPYPHGIVKRVFTDDVALRLAEWIANPGTWHECDRADPQRQSFYWTSGQAPRAVTDILTPGLMQELREQAQEAFNTNFAEDFPVSANRYPAGRGIKIHNDFFPDPSAHPHFFTHRLIAYLSRDAKSTDGGLLGIFERDDPATRVRTMVPYFNSGALMAMGPTAFHAVSTVKESVRYSLGFSFTNSSGNYK